MSGVKSFGQMPDLNFRTLCCKNQMIIDKNCNLSVNSAKMNKLLVRQDLTVNGILKGNPAKTG